MYACAFPSAVVIPSHGSYPSLQESTSLAHLSVEVNMVALDSGSSDGVPKASSGPAKVKKGKGKKSSGGGGGLPRMTVSVSWSAPCCYACRPHDDGGRRLSAWPVQSVFCVL